MNNRSFLTAGTAAEAVVSTVAEVLEEAKVPRGAKDTVKLVSGSLLIPLAIWLFSSPLPIARVIVRAGSTGAYSFIPYLMLVMNCFSWVVLSLQSGLAEYYEAFIVNAYGLIANAVVLALYFYFITDPQVRKRFLVWVPMATFPLVVLATISFMSASNNCSHPDSFHCWWGKLTMLCNLAIFCGPMVAFRRACKTRSAQYLPLGQSLAGLISSSNCSIYFLCLWDVNGLVPGVGGVCLSLCQIVFYMAIVTCYDQELVEEPASGTSILDPVIQACSTSGSYLLGGHTILATSFISGPQSQSRQVSGGTCC